MICLCLKYKPNLYVESYILFYMYVLPRSGVLLGVPFSIVIRALLLFGLRSKNSVWLVSGARVVVRPLDWRVAGSGLDCHVGQRKGGRNIRCAEGPCETRTNTMVQLELDPNPREASRKACSLDSTVRL